MEPVTRCGREQNRRIGPTGCAGPFEHERLVGWAEQLCLASSDVLTQSVEVQVGFAHLREHLACLCLDVVVDVLAQHFHIGVLQWIVWRAGLDLGNQILRAGVFDLGFVDQVFVLTKYFARGRIEKFFLSGGVCRQLGADLQCDGLVLANLGFSLDELVVFLEKPTSRPTLRWASPPPTAPMPATASRAR